MSDVLILSCYELGRPPSGAASPLAWLARAGIPAEGVDLSVGKLSNERIAAARFIGISTPMHTALALGVKTARRIRDLNPDATICFFGLYARLNSRYLLDTVADHALGGEFEQDLVRLVGGKAGPKGYAVADRRALGSLEQYAKLDYMGQKILAGYAETSRGCKHTCAHCPVTPVYGGRFFIVPVDIVLEDIRRQAADGAKHISFGDPDFLNGPSHARRVVAALNVEFPHITFDFTTKIEHVLAHRAVWEEFSQAGCLFVVSAVESLSESVLRHLVKGHTRSDVDEALGILRGAGIALRPSLVSFTPWTSLDDFIEVLDWVEREKLFYNVDPVHFAIRLLVPPGSPLAADPAINGRLRPEAFSIEWSHPDERMDRLQEDVLAIVMRGELEDARSVFAEVKECALALKENRAPRKTPPVPPAVASRPPRMTESWFCCAEPTERQLGSV